MVPLTDRMLEILAQARALHPDSAFVFPALKGKMDHLDAHAMTRAFARICSRYELSAGLPHDVRRSGATTLVGRYGVSRLVVGMLLGHTAREGRQPRAFMIGIPTCLRNGRLLRCGRIISPRLRACKGEASRQDQATMSSI